MERLMLILSIHVVVILHKLMNQVVLNKWSTYRNTTDPSEYYWEVKAFCILKKYGILETKQVGLQQYIKINTSEIEKTVNLLPQKHSYLPVKM